VELASAGHAEAQIDVNPVLNTADEETATVIDPDGVAVILNPERLVDVYVDTMRLLLHHQKQRLFAPNPVGRSGREC